MLSIQEQVLASFETLKDMLTDRGVSIDGLTHIGPVELEELCTTQSIFTIEVNPSLNVVYYLTKMKIAEFKSALFGKSKDVDNADIMKNDAKSFIFIFKDDISSQNRKAITEFFKKHQVFQIRRLLFNVSRHSLVPKHEVVRDDNDIKDLFERFNVKNKASLPVIHQGDQMAMYLGLVPGDIVKITRPSPTAGYYAYYRVCVA